MCHYGRYCICAYLLGRYLSCLCCFTILFVFVLCCVWAGRFKDLVQKKKERKKVYIVTKPKIILKKLKHKHFPTLLCLSLQFPQKIGIQNQFQETNLVALL